MEGDTASATVYAILALAAVVNRLADAQQARTDLEMDRTYPRNRLPAGLRRRFYRPPYRS